VLNPFALPGLIKEYRGNVFSIGANTSNSIVNYFSFYNRGLVGASIGNTLPIANKNDYMDVVLPNPSISRLNAGESGAIATDIIAQIDYLRNQLLTTYKYSVNFTHDWKHLTLLIGANNLCQACVNEARSSPANYEAALDEAFAYLRTQIPRTFVSVITMIKLSTVYNTIQTSTYCKSVRTLLFQTECLCISKDYSAAGLQKVDQYSVEYNNILYKLAAKYQALNDPDFTVKVQPATQNFTIPSSIGVNFLSEFDCFHPSGYADASLAVALWNNLMSPSQAQKLTTINPSDPFTCPDDNTFLM